MYPTIYRKLKETGRVQTAVILNGKNAGARCVIENGKCLSGKNMPQPGWDVYERTLENVKKTMICKTQGEEILVEILEENPHLVILGGGHVSVPVAKIGKMLGFHVTVMDDREEFLTEERFPDADIRVHGRFEELSEKIPVYENTYYVVVTRGHRGDSECARQILKRPYIYFGMIGSRTKVRLTRETLLKEGFSLKSLDTIHAPIGLPIGGNLPEEIAVSIMAEIVQVKNRYPISYTDERVAAAVLEGRKGTMMTIVEKNGSSPRGTGSRMFLDEAGNSFGSIGGGSVEYEAMKHAPDVRKAEVRDYNLSVSDDQNLGMICGGKVRVFFEKIGMPVES